VPHVPASVLPHVAAQSTPRLPLLTVAASVAEDPADSVAGSENAGDGVTAITAPVVTVAAAVANFVLSVVDRAVIVTVPPGGIVEGPEKVIGLPLAEWAGEKLPHVDAEQVADQSTPAAVGSLRMRLLQPKIPIHLAPKLGRTSHRIPTP
jgi:hypothetical protein